MKIDLSKYKNQILAGLAVNLASMAHGTMLGWMSPTMYLLNSEDTPFGNPLTTDQESWVGSCISIGGFMGTLLFGSLIDRIGRKYTMLMLGLPNLIAWVVIFFSSEIYHLYIARYVTGLTGGGIYSTLPIFIAEIADNNIRGSLGSVLLLVVNIGLTTGYVLTSYLPFRLVPLIGMWIPILYTLMIAYLPETPRYLLINGKEGDAERSYKFYTNFQGRTKEEFQKYTKDFQELKVSLKSSMSSESKLQMSDFCNRVSIKAIVAGVILVILNQITGSFVILNYSSKIFAETGSMLSPNLATILMGVTQIVGTYFATMLVDRCGRKPLFILSLLGMLIGLLSTGLYHYFSKVYDLEAYAWIPIVSISFAIFSTSFGINPLPILIIVEMVPGKIRSYVSMFCLEILSSFAFITLKTFPLLMDALNLYGVMWICSGFCLAGIIFVWLFIPETKGKVLQESAEPIVVANDNKC